MDAVNIGDRVQTVEGVVSIVTGVRGEAGPNGFVLLAQLGNGSEWVSAETLTPCLLTTDIPEA